MESNSSASGEKLNNIKTRKPYTITKQRERWTDDEHNSFLEALKLYGRAWQRIEEHIGTKTAVQIRSHAQKFFTKLEKEAVAKGVPISQALDIEIPPPRPKRKPNYPYPRNIDPNTHTQLAQKDYKQTTLASSLQLLHLEIKPFPEDKEKLGNVKTSEQVQTGTTEGPQEAPCSENENSVPNESHVTIETRKHQEVDQTGIKKNTDTTSNNSLFESSHENIFHDPCSDMHGSRTCPRHVPVQLVDVNQGLTTSVPPEMSLHESNVNNLGEVYENANPNVSAASETSGHHNNATFHPLFNACNDNNQHESYRYFNHFSSAISSLVVSSLLQNPVAHAAASFAAKYWHPVNTEVSSADSFSRDRLNPETTTSPSMATIAAATVAAATAWWSAHGLLPVCTPFYQGGYMCTFGTPADYHISNNGRDKATSEGVMREEKTDFEKIESAAADDLSSSDDSEKKLSKEVIPVDINGTVLVVESSKLTNGGKQVDRSSCGSNTTSSSEIEMGVLEKHWKETEETKALDVKESLSRRGRSIITPTESWKEVSEEGRLAFQALFSREVLPQSFSDIHTKGQQNMINNSELDLNRMSQQEPGESNGNGFAVLRNGLRSVKLNHHRTGFKPYKRCSIEAKESSKIMGAGKRYDENGPKRMRLEAKAST